MTDEPTPTTAEHPLETGARALGGGVLTEVLAALAAAAMAATYGGVIGAGWSALLAHAVGVGLGASVVVALVERARLRAGWLAGAAVGLLGAPLAPLGGWYVLDVVDTFDVTLATQGVLVALRGTSLADACWLAGVALLGYGPALVARARGVSVAGQVAASAWGLTLLGATATALDGVEGSWPLRAWTAVVLARALALPLGLALGDGLGVRLVRALRRDDAPRERRAWPRVRPLLGLLPLLLAVLAASAACRDEPLEVSRARWGARDLAAREALGRDLASEGVRQFGVSPRWNMQSARSGWAWATTPRWSRAGAWAGRGAPPTAPSLRERPLLAGPPALINVTGESPPVVGLHASAVACLRAPAEAGSPSAMIHLATVLESGTRFERRDDEHPGRWYFQRGRHVRSRVELAEALRWWRRAAEAGDPFAQRELGHRLLGAPRERESGLAWLRRAHEGGDGAAARLLAFALLDETPEEALRWARLAARQQAADVDLLRQVLARHPHLRAPADDWPLVARPGLESVRGELVALPWSVLLRAAPTSSGEPLADALARAAWALVTRGEHDSGRALAIAALRRRPGHRTASLLLVAHHLRAAGASGVAPDHVVVAEAYLDATTSARDALDPRVLLAGGLCDAARALLVPALDRGWAQRARERLTAAVAVGEEARAGEVLAQVEALLARRGLRDPWSTAGLLGAHARRHEQAARRSVHEPGAARDHQAAAARLRRLAGE